MTRNSLNKFSFIPFIYDNVFFILIPLSNDSKSYHYLHGGHVLRLYTFNMIIPSIIVFVIRALVEETTRWS
jgi:hypothetical protein